MGKRGNFYDADYICEQLIPQDSFYRKFREIVAPLIKDKQFASMYCADNGRTIQYTYDANSNRLTLTDPLANQTQYGYDSLNRLSTLQNPQGQLSFSYDTLGRRIELDYPNGLKDAYTYDAASNLSSISLQNTSTTLLSTTY